MSKPPANEPAAAPESPEALPSKPAKGFWAEAWSRFRHRKLGMLALVFVCLLGLVAIFSPAIAGTKPIVCKYKGNIYFPALGYFDRSWENPVFFHDRFRNVYPKNLKEKDPHSWAIWPLVYQDPYRRVRAANGATVPATRGRTKASPAR